MLELICVDKNDIKNIKDLTLMNGLIILHQISYKIEKLKLGIRQNNYKR